MEGCPCGWPHEVPEAYRRAVAGQPSWVTARAGGRAWRVPHLWVQVHGLTAATLPELARLYGWPRAAAGLAPSSRRR